MKEHEIERGKKYTEEFVRMIREQAGPVSANKVKSISVQWIDMGDLVLPNVSIEFYE